MALRPVSELGLVEVTDLDPPAPTAAETAARVTSASKPRARTAAPPPPPDVTADAGRGHLGVSILSGVIGVAGACILGRAALQR